MAVITITPVTLEPNVASVDLNGAGASVITSNTFSIPVLGNTRTIQIFMEELGGGAATVVFDPGDLPPSFLNGLNTGGLTVNLATSDQKEIRLQPGQFIQSDGTITGSVGGQTVSFYVLRESNAE